MGWLDDLARKIERGTEETIQDVGHIIDRALGLED